jgi:hypothetical protein
MRCKDCPEDIATIPNEQLGAKSRSVLYTIKARALTRAINDRERIRIREVRLCVVLCRGNR